MNSIFLYKIKKLVIRLPELAIILCFLSCHNPVAITEVKSVDKAYLSIQIGGQERTVLPNSIDISDMAISIVFEGTKSGSEEKVEYTWNPKNFFSAYMQMCRDPSICVGTGTWDFTLKILQNGNLILIGSINNKAIKSGNNTLNFVLYPTDISGSGNVAVTLQFPSDAGVAKVDAGLYTLEDTEVAGSKTNLDIGNGTTGTSQVVYAKNDIASGEYLIQFNLYGNNGVLMNTYMELVTVVSECTSSAKCSLSSLNTLYTIEYTNINGATWTRGASVPYSYNTDMSVTLPTEKDITLDGCIFLGWYENANFSGDPVSGWSPERTGDVKLYANWKVEAWALSAGTTICSLRNNIYTVVVAGYATRDIITNIVAALIERTFDIDVYLDLSLVTDLEEIPAEGFKGCYNLRSILLPNTITKIATKAFAECHRLSSVTIPEDVTHIENKAFLNCSSLKNVTFSDPLGWASGENNLEDLSNPKTAANYLKSTYLGSDWNKE